MFPAPLPRGSYLGRPKLDVACRFASTGARSSIIVNVTMSSVRTRGMTKSAAESSREMHIIAKTASKGDLADWLAGSQQRPAMHKMCGMVQAMRIDEFVACRAALGEKLLDVSQRNPRFAGHLGGPEIRIWKTVLDHAADARE